METYLVYNDGVPISDAVQTLLDAGWEVETDSGDIEYEVEYSSRRAESLDAAFAEWELEEDVALTVHTDGLELHVSTYGEWTDVPSLCLWCPTKKIDYRKVHLSEETATENLNRYIDAIQQVARRRPPLYGFGGLDINFEPERIPTRDDVLRGEFSYLFWLVLLPIGEDGYEWEHLKDTPFWAVERVTPGVAMLLLSDNPAYPTTDWKRTKRNITAHLQDTK